jgi:carbon-monoxide dehydrogenase medium subunit
VKPAPFEYHTPATLADALALLAELGEDGRVIAGGQSLVPLLALRLASVDHLVDLNRVEGLGEIEEQPDSVLLGAMVRQSRLVAHENLGASVPLLGRAARCIGHFQIRNRGTLGGSLAHADPAAELPAVAVALDATMHVAGHRRRRTIAAVDFFHSTFTTGLTPGEILHKIEFPVWHGRTGFAVRELARRAGDFAIAGAVCGVRVDAGGTIDRAAIGLFGMGSAPIRPDTAVKMLIGRSATDLDTKEVGMLAVSGLEPPDDIHATGRTRRQVGAVMVARAVTDAIREATSA